VQPLPTMTQLAPVNAIICADFNADGHTDIVVAGNSFSANISSGRYDAGFGLLLMGDGVGGFVPMPADRSGFYVRGVVKSLASLTLSSEKKCILAGIHNGLIRVFDSTLSEGKKSPSKPTKPLL